jgi:hypothetical protein
MCPPVLDGQPVSAAITNPSFIDAVVDDSAAGIITFANTNPASGATVSNIQKESNSAASFMGKALNSSATDLPVYTNNEVGAANDPLFDRVDALSGKFNASGGHAHTGAAGDAPAITASDLASVPLRGFVRQGINVTTGTGSSILVTIDFGSQTPGGSALAEGVVTDPPFNKVLLRQATGANAGDLFIDTLGNEVYARLTYAALNWTLSFYVDLAGVETAYSFPSSQTAAIYYQEIFNPMVAPPTYSEFAVIPSDNVTADILTATTVLQGKVSLATTAQPVGSTSSAGTANASVANENHTHAGVHSISKSGDPQILGDATFTGTGGTTLTQLAQNIEISSPALTSATPEDISATAAVGVATDTARADHVHAGVYAVDAGFGDKLGTVTVAASGQTSLSDTVGGFSIDSPSFTATAAEDVASTGAAGVSTDMARADHVHRGVASVAKNGSSQLFGDVTLSAGTGITLNQVGQDIEIVNAGPALSNNTPQDVGATASAGVGTVASRDDHVHEGLHSIAKSGDPQILGDATLSASGAITLTQLVNDIQISAPATDTATTPQDVGSSGSPGVSTSPAPADHVHEGLHSIAKNGDPALFGDVTLSAGANITLTQTGQDILIDSTGGSGAATIIDIAASSAGIAIGDAVYLDGTGTLQKLDASDDSKIEFLGFALAAGGGANQVQVAGEIEITGATFTVGSPVFADPSTPGGYVVTAPSNAGQWVIQLGVAVAADKLAINGAGSATAVKITSEVDAYVYAAVSTISSNTVLTNAQSIILANGGAGGISVTLPGPTAGKIFNIKKIDATAGAVTILPPSGLIDGAASKVVSVQYDSFTITSDGTNFFII